MSTIWKYELERKDEQLIEMPAGAEILCVQVQCGTPVLWARVDPDVERIKRLIITHGTGHQLSDKTGEYLGSYQTVGSALVFHVFTESEK